MNKKLKFIIAGFAVVAGLASAVSCQDLSKDVDSLSKEVASLKTLVNDLQTKINAGAVITNVASTSTGIEITLSDGKKYTVSNGKDGANGTNGTNGTNGKDGKDGTPGSVVSIGDNGNWFIDGVDTGLAAKGKDGANGTNGTNGANGLNGDYYVPNPETGYFDKYSWDAEKGEYVKTATEIPFVGIVPGTVTAVYDTASGVLTILGAKGFEGPITVSLTTDLKSIAFIPEVMHDGLGVIDFYGVMAYPNTPAAIAKAVADPVKERPIGLSEPWIRYRLNPTNTEILKYKWGFLDRNVETRAAHDDRFNLIDVKNGINDGGEFYLNVALNSEWLFEEEPTVVPVFAQMARYWGYSDVDGWIYQDYPWNYDYLYQYQYYCLTHRESNNWRYFDDVTNANNNKDLVALVAVDENGNEIVSDYAQVDFGWVDRFFIIHNDQYFKPAQGIIEYPTPDGSTISDYPNRNVPTGVMTETVGNNKKVLTAEAKVALPLTATPDFSFRFDKEANIKDSLLTYAPGARKLMEELGFEVEYKFATPDEYLAADAVKTNQQKFVTVSADGIMKLNAEFLPENGRAAVGRTPVVKVQSYIAGTDVLLAEAWIKVRIANDESSEERPDFEYVVPAATFEYDDFSDFSWDTDDYDAKSKFTLTWEEMNVNVLNKIETSLHTTPGISFAEFKALYDNWNIEMTYPKYGTTAYIPHYNYYDEDIDDYVTNGIIADKTVEWDDVETDVAGIYFSKNFDIENGKTYEGKVVLKIQSLDTYTAPDILLTFPYTVKHEHPWPEVNPDYYLGKDEATGMDIVQVKGRKVGTEVKFESEMREHFKDYLKGSKGYWKQPANHDNMGFELRKWNKATQTGAEITGTYCMDQIIKLTEALVDDHKDYVVTMYDVMQNNPFYKLDTNGNYVVVTNADGSEYVSECTKTYIVRFKNIFQINLAKATLLDKIEPTTVNLASYIDPTKTGAALTKETNYYLYITDDDNNVIWKGGSVTDKATALYGLKDDDITVAYGLLTPGFERGTLTITGSEVKWENLGTRLVNDKVGAWYPKVEIKTWVKFNTKTDKDGNPTPGKTETVTVKAQN